MGDKKEINMLDLFRFESGEGEIVDSTKITSVDGSDIPFKEDLEEQEESEEVETTEESETEETDQEEESEEQEETEEEIVDETEESTEEQDDEGVYNTLANILIEEGVLIPKEDKEYLDAEIGIKELVEDTAEFKFKQHVDSLENTEIREGVTFKDFAEYIQNGGDPQYFIENVSQVDYRKVDITTDEDNLEQSIETQKLVIRDKLLLEELSEEEIDETISQYEESNMLEKQAKLSLKALVKKQDEEYTRMIEAQEEAKQARIVEMQKQDEMLKTTISSSKEIPDGEKDAYYKYLTVPVKKDANGNLLTQYQLDTLDLNRRLEMAYVQFKGGVKGIEKKVTHKNNAKLKEKLSRLNLEDRNNSKSTDSFDEEVKPTKTTTKVKFKMPHDWMN